MKENNKIFLGRMKYILIGIGLAVFCVSTVFPSPISYAQTQGKAEWVLPKHYPDKFDGTGRIDRIAKDEIVIDDCWYGFSPFVKFATPKRKDASRSGFRPGDFVGYTINPKKQIIFLWLLKQ